MRIELPPISDAERTPLVVALLAIIDLQQQRLQALEETVLQLRDEMALRKRVGADIERQLREARAGECKLADRDQVVDRNDRRDAHVDRLAGFGDELPRPWRYQRALRKTGQTLQCVERFGCGPRA